MKFQLPVNLFTSQYATFLQNPLQLNYLFQYSIRPWYLFFNFSFIPDFLYKLSQYKQDFEMDESSGYNTSHRWKKVYFNNDKSEQKSMISRDSSKHSRYTPKKQLKAQENKLNLNILKDKIPSMRSFITVKSQFGEGNGINNGEPKILANALRRTNSIDRESQNINFLDKYNTRWSNLIDLKKDKQAQLSHDNELFEKNGQFPSRNEFDSRAPLTERKQKAEIAKRSGTVKIERLENLMDKTQMKKSIHQLDPPTTVTSQPTIEEMFKNYISWIKTLEEQINNERIQITKMLEEKQRHFLKVKEQIYKIFAEKENQISSPQLRLLIEDYLPKKAEQKNSLTRVTSQRLFNRISNLQINQRNSLLAKFDKLNTNIEQSNRRTDLHSMKSNTNQTIKENFNTIFSTINEMKKRLGQNEPEIPKRNQQNKVKDKLLTPKENPKNTVAKQSLLGMASLKKLRKSMMKDDDKSSHKRSQTFNESIQVNLNR